MKNTAHKKLYIIKKDGRIQEFNQEKLFTSVANASDDIEEPLTTSDIYNLVRDIVKKLENRNTNNISSADIREETLNSLKELGFSDVYERYGDFARENDT